MPCINPDGTLTQTAEKVLKAIPVPSNDSQIGTRMSFPVFLVRSSLRQLVDIGLVRETDGIYELTDLGREKLSP